jgi:Zn-dependent alcohol dehydrogenase
VLADVPAFGLYRADLVLATRSHMPTPAVLDHEVAGVVASDCTELATDGNQICRR